MARNMYTIHSVTLKTNNHKLINVFVQAQCSETHTLGVELLVMSVAALSAIISTERLANVASVWNLTVG